MLWFLLKQPISTNTNVRLTTLIHSKFVAQTDHDNSSQYLYSASGIILLPASKRRNPHNSICLRVFHTLPELHTRCT